MALRNRLIRPQLVLKQPFQTLFSQQVVAGGIYIFLYRGSFEQLEGKGSHGSEAIPYRLIFKINLDLGGQKCRSGRPLHLCMPQVWEKGTTTVPRVDILQPFGMYYTMEIYRRLILDLGIVTLIHLIEK